jgi:hypothetical protein
VLAGNNPRFPWRPPRQANLRAPRRGTIVQATSPAASTESLHPEPRAQEATTPHSRSPRRGQRRPEANLARVRSDVTYPCNSPASFALQTLEAPNTPGTCYPVRHTIGFWIIGLIDHYVTHSGKEASINESRVDHHQGGLLGLATGPHRSLSRLASNGESGWVLYYAGRERTRHPLSMRLPEFRTRIQNLAAFCEPRPTPIH